MISSAVLFLTCVSCTSAYFKVCLLAFLNLLSAESHGPYQRMEVPQTHVDITVSMTTEQNQLNCDKCDTVEISGGKKPVSPLPYKHILTCC